MLSRHASGPRARRSVPEAPGSPLTPVARDEAASTKAGAEPVPAAPRRRRRTTLVGSFGHALHGLIELAAFERNMKIHVWTGMAVSLVASEMQLPHAAQLAVLLCIMLVLSGEALNSALERLVDLHTTTLREEARAVKDSAAGAVLVFACGTLVVAAVVVLRSWEDAAPSLQQVGAHAVPDGAALALGALLLCPWRRHGAIDLFAAGAGAVLLGMAALRTVSPPFAVAAIALFLVAAASRRLARAGQEAS